MPFTELFACMAGINSREGRALRARVNVSCAIGASDEPEAQCKRYYGTACSYIGVTLK